MACAASSSRSANPRFTRLQKRRPQRPPFLFSALYFASPRSLWNFYASAPIFAHVTVSENRMPSTVREFKTGNAEAQIAAAYNEAGYRYGKYADGGGRTLFTFDGRHAYGDRKC